jgi:hypothetical protein
MKSVTEMNRTNASPIPKHHRHSRLKYGLKYEITITAASMNQNIGDLK